MSVFFAAGYAVHAQIPDLTNVRIITTHVSGNVYMLEATGDVAGNIGVSAGPDGLLLIDTQFAPLAEKIRDALRSIESGEVRYIINTHHHEDHTHGNQALGEEAVIIGHAKTRSRLLDISPQKCPDLIFETRLTVFFNEEKIDLYHFPEGHTDNDVVVHFTESNVFHLGDLWNSGISSFPTVDIEAGGSVMGMLKHIDSLIQIIPPDAKIIPGHYSFSDMEDLKRTRRMLVETISLVREKMDAGKSLDRIKKEGLPPAYEKWGCAYTSAEEWIENLYSALQKEKRSPGK
jgi:glyoxylase-like metal-dependent hydrolase (beta-lactamase superfamily II)